MLVSKPSRSNFLRIVEVLENKEEDIKVEINRTERPAAGVFLFENLKQNALSGVVRTEAQLCEMRTFRK